MIMIINTIETDCRAVAFFDDIADILATCPRKFCKRINCPPSKKVGKHWSRATEKAIVSQFLYPCFSSPPASLSFSDQFAFRPTGSTTAAIIANLQIVSQLLVTNPYVHIFALDFSKAFDSIRHSTLLEKMSMQKSYFLCLSCFLLKN